MSLILLYTFNMFSFNKTPAYISPQYQTFKDSIGQAKSDTLDSHTFLPQFLPYKYAAVHHDNIFYKLKYWFQKYILGTAPDAVDLSPIELRSLIDTESLYKKYQGKIQKTISSELGLDEDEEKKRELQKPHHLKDKYIAQNLLEKSLQDKQLLVNLRYPPSNSKKRCSQYNPQEDAQNAYKFQKIRAQLENQQNEEWDAEQENKKISEHELLDIPHTINDLNYYNTDLLPPYLPKKPFIHLFVAPRGQGKTVRLTNWINTYMRNAFHNIHFFSPNCLEDKQYSLVLSQLEIPAENVHIIFKESEIMNIFNSASSINQTLIIVEDCGNDQGFQSASASNILSRIAQIGRHPKCSLILTTQYLKGINRRVRVNCDCITLFSVENYTELQNIAEDFAGDVDPKAYMAAIAKATQESYHWVNILPFNNPAEGREKLYSMGQPIYFRPEQMLSYDALLEENNSDNDNDNVSEESDGNSSE